MAAIQGNLAAIETGQQPAIVYRPPFQPYKKHPKYTGLIKKLALCKEIQDHLSQMERTIEKMESREAENHEKHRGR